MGSINRYSSLERFDYEFGEKIKKYYEQQLLGVLITDIDNITFDYFKSAEIKLSTSLILSIHFGWSTEEEKRSGEEELTDGDVSIVEYFSQNLKGKEIINIVTGYDRDDEHYTYAFVDELNGIEIPTGFDPENYELHDNTIITEEEFENFLIKYGRKQK